MFSRLPFATIGLILVNLVVFILTWGALDDGLEREQESRSRVVHYYVEHDYLSREPENRGQALTLDT